MKLTLSIAMLCCLVGCTPTSQHPMDDTAIIPKQLVSVEKPTNVTPDTFVQLTPRIYQNRVAWIDFRHNTNPRFRTHFTLHSKSTSEIYMRDLKTKKNQRITKRQSYKYGLQITDGFLLWRERPFLNSFDSLKWVLLNLSNGQETILPKGSSGCRLLPRNQLLIQKAKGTFVTRNLETTAETVVLHRPQAQMKSVLISTNYISWVENRKLVVRHRKTQKETVIARDYDVSPWGGPVLAGNTLVYTLLLEKDPRRRAKEYWTYGLYMVDLTDPKPLLLYGGPKRVASPFVGDSFITCTTSTSGSTYLVFSLRERRLVKELSTNVSYNSYTPLQVSNGIATWADAHNIFVLKLRIDNEDSM